MTRKQYLESFFAWRKSVGETLRTNRQKQGDRELEKFLARLGEDRPFLSQPHVWQAFENGRIRAAKHKGDGIALAPDDYVRAIRTQMSIYGYSRRSPEGKELEGLIGTKPSLGD